MKYLIKENGFKFIVSVFIQILYSLCTVGVAFLLNYLIDTVSTVIETQNMHDLFICAVICIAYAFVLGILTFTNERLKASCIKKLMVNLRTKIGNGILSQNRTGEAGKNSGTFITLLNQNMSNFEENYIKNLYVIIASFSSIAAGIVLLVLINPIVALISIIAMAIPGLIPRLFSKKLGMCQRKIIKTSSQYNSMVNDLLNGDEVIRTFQIEQSMNERHTLFAEEMEESKLHLTKMMSVLLTTTGFASVAIQFFIMTLSGIFAIKGFITIGSIVAVTQLSGQVISPAFSLSTKLAQLKGTKPVIQAMDEIITSGEEQKNTMERKPVTNSIELKNLSYSYGDNQVLDKVNVTFEAGKKYLITGKSGSGKSTLIKLLSGQYRYINGDMLVDGKKALCDVSLVSQNVFLFNDSIKNNITLYHPYSDEEIQTAVTKAGLKPVLDGLEDGLNTLVMENGERFSGGERQRIAIARALLHGKSTLLLDEATSALDEDTAKKIETELLNLKGITCIEISHKCYPEILSQYDGIYNMKDGNLSQVS